MIVWVMKGPKSSLTRFGWKGFITRIRHDGKEYVSVGNEFVSKGKPKPCPAWIIAKAWHVAFDPSELPSMPNQLEDAYKKHLQLIA